ncbi:glycerol-3-phosphate dehydrogenase/oxidase [Cerasicoccus arenae]|uniref:Glycerol-3-phosphate dehydrogenase n=1 Tax=Cerasicoccus arenae TaxID=424488 RepID=A0A8J3DAW7_9BACT|nr:glycerol-3-phosphate dehydrogenase/oxidase [Cerasicoccus arenae]MBK1858155.1 glycerol-3-phosphate dehydrogenase/oxidase [Cerasicoccus arenae]GHB96822.1 glycerol-3-phosphate dehydrogenase [Cerasicoccus arenae]
MNRDRALDQLKNHDEPFDFVIIGGGATGLGCAVDAASRGHSVVLIEQADFAKATSSRSTKLVHGGVRYLKQGNISLVLEALKERGRLCVNAPHLVSHQAFIVPIYSWWEGPFYGIGMKVYDMLAGKLGLETSQNLSRKETLERIPTLEQDGLQGGVIYYDGQFDDSRLAVNLAQTVFDQGGIAVNYVKAVGLEKEAGLISGVECEDVETNEHFHIRARAVINATGVFTDGVRHMDDPSAQGMVAASQGVHLVLPKEFVPGDAAVMVPHTTDGRVLFAVPWHDHVVVGTTDTPTENIDLEPRPLEEEIDFILANAAQYLARDPKRSDVLSVFAGLRPLVKSSGSGNTAAISRDHTIVVSDSGLVTICGGKWTTYRKMAEDCIDHAEMIAGLEQRPCVTAELKIHGHTDSPTNDHPLLSLYGSDGLEIHAAAKAHPELAALLHPDLPYTVGEVHWAVKHEMARKAEDVLARRMRALFLNAQAAHDCAQSVADIMAGELGHSTDWATAEAQRFQKLASGYMVK